MKSKITERKISKCKISDRKNPEYFQKCLCKFK